MRKLIVIARTKHVRNLIESGALDDLEDGETYWLASERWVPDKSALESKPGYLGAVDVSKRRGDLHKRIRNLLLFSLSRRSKAMRIKTETSDIGERRRLRLESLPLVRRFVLRRLLRRLGLNEDLHRAMSELRPDLVIAPSAGTEDLALDAVQSARELGVPSLMLIPNWDNLSSKGSFPIKPDHLGVWGEQSVEQAERIHGIPRERVTALGAPWLDPYFRHEPGSSPSHFPFPYVLFAGCFKPFDELSALEALEREIEQRGLDLKVVYRPHPVRSPRKVPDFVDESRFRHVVIDPQVRDAYDDGVHENSPDVMVEADYFEGVDSIEGFEMCRSSDDLPRVFTRLAAADPVPPRSLRAQIGWWLYHDERPYSRRVADLVERIGAERGLRGAARPPSEAEPASARS